MFSFLSYEVLQVTWWLLLGVLLIGFAIMDGFDLGAAILLPFVSKNDNERRIVLNSVGPVWDGNQVWLLLGAGAILAAWPVVYAVSFSGTYFAILLVLLALILRPVGFEFRSKINSHIWRSTWDTCLFISGFVPALVFGVAVGNAMMGLDFTFNEYLVIENHIKFFSLFTPFTVLCGLLSVAMLVMHGAVFLAIKTSGEIQNRLIKVLNISPFVVVSLYLLGGVFALYANNYELVGEVHQLGKANVIMTSGALLHNYLKYPIFLLSPLSVIIGIIGVILLVRKRYFARTFIFSGLTLFGIISTAGVSMFPFILPSRFNPSASLVVWNASSSQSTLLIMLIASLIFVPIVLFYTSWVFSVLRGKTEKDSSSHIY